MEPTYRTIMLKLSGEALLGEREFGVDPDVLDVLSSEIKEVKEMGVKVAIVIGGGNIFRGIEGSARGMERATADYVGMLATVLNALMLQDALEKRGLEVRVVSAIEMKEVAEPYIRRKAIRHLEKGRVVIFAAGTGNPYFTTDTAASLRAMEMHADVIIKATKVDGVYDKDPEKDPSAIKYDELTYTDVINRDLRVMDTTAVALCRENKLPIIVYNLKKKGNILKILQNEKIGTIIREK